MRSAAALRSIPGAPGQGIPCGEERFRRQSRHRRGTVPHNIQGRRGTHRRRHRHRALRDLPGMGEPAQLRSQPQLAHSIPCRARRRGMDKGLRAGQGLEAPGPLYGLESHRTEQHVRRLQPLRRETMGRLARCQPRDLPPRRGISQRQVSIRGRQPLEGREARGVPGLQGQGGLALPVVCGSRRQPHSWR